MSDSPPKAPGQAPAPSPGPSPDDPALASTDRAAAPRPRSQKGDLPEGHRVGPYRVLRKLGQGGMGTVYLAIHEQIERHVAVKVLRPAYSQNPDVARRFLNEARAVNRVRHPALVQISDYGQLADGSAYLIMEYLEGTPLGAHLKQIGGKLPEQAACGLGRAIAQGLLAAHEKQIVHRDLKPDNVMLVPDPARPGALQVKLLDFGIAKLLDAGTGARPVENGTEIGTMLGTPAYMSPEQIRGAATVDARADVYALGVMLYQMLAGRLPFDVGGGATGYLAKHLYEPPKPLSETAPEVSQAAADLVLAMLAKDPAQRPSMARVVQALRPLARGEPEGRRAPGLPGRRVAIAAGLTAAALVATGVVLWRRAGVAGAPAPGAPAGVAAVPGRCSADGWCVDAIVPGGRALRRGGTAPGRGVWIVGEQGLILHRAAGRAGPYQPVPSGTTRKLAALAIPPEGPVLIGGEGGTLLRADPQGAQPVPLPDATYVTAISLGAAGGWLVGKDGALLRLGAGGWEPAPALARENLYDLCTLPGGAAWAVGRGGVALRFDGKDWQRVETGTGRQLQGVLCLGPDEVWAAGKEGALLRWDGRAFRAVASGTTQDLNALVARPGEIFAVGDQGTILRVSGDRASAQQSGVSEDLHHAFLDGASVVAIGGGGVVLRR